MYSAPKTNGEVRHSVALLLHRETAAMKLDNFVVRPRRRTVEEVLQIRRLDGLIA